MNKVNVKVDVLKKMIARLVKAAPAKRVESPDPLARLIRAFLEYDCDEARASVAERKITEAMVDFNELRVTPAIELAALLGVRYPFAESRCSALHRTLQSIFDREHQMRLDKVKEMKKTEIRPYLQSLAGITPYVEAAVCVDAFGVPAAPVDTKLLLWLISKDVLPEGTDIKSAQHVIEKHLKSTEAEEFFHGARREIEDWSPKSWPQVAKAYSPILAPPPIDAPVELEEAKGPKKPEVHAKDAGKGKAPAAVAGKKK
jgi:endonuclease III